MEETFERVKSWVSAHPWLAAGIALILAVVIYLIYKQMSASGGAVSTGTSADQTAGATDGGIPAVTDSGIGAISGGGNPPPAPTHTGSEQGNVSNAGAYIPPDLGALGSSSGGEFSFTSGQSGLSQNGLPAAISPSPAINNETVGSLMSAAGIQPLASPIAAAPQSLLSIAAVKPPAGLVMPTKTKQMATQSLGHALTPAQQVGKGRNFTGTFQGIQYVNGYPASYGGYNAQGGYTEVIAGPGAPITNVVSQQLLNYGATSSPVLNQPGTAAQPAVFHGH